MQQNERNKKISIVASIIFLCLPVLSYAQDFSGFAVQAMLGRDGTLGIEEHFIFEPTDSGYHGVVREIPLFSSGKDPHAITFHMVSVSDKTYHPYKYDASSGGNVALVKIGDPDVILKGSHYYDFRYTLSGLATNNSLRWQIITPVIEPIKKFQADLYFPLPVPVVTATSSCAYIPDRTGRGCTVQPLVKDAKLYGYRISAENVVKDGLMLEVHYPRGLVEPPLVKTHDAPWHVPAYVWYLFSFILFFSILSYILWHFRVHIVKWREERKKPVVLPDTYAYLSRAAAAGRPIAPRDILATIADLTARGYIELSPIAHPVGEFEFIDYALNVPTADLPGGAEGVLLEIITEHGGISSLNEWLKKDYAEDLPRISLAAQKEVEGVVLLHSDEPLPDLPGFKSERFS
jgi:hypothetical protein